MRSASRRAQLAAYALLLVATVISLVPTIYMVDISLRDSVDSFTLF
jgi:ABC-type glycerol-3-phosphate transport system permease component